MSRPLPEIAAACRENEQDEYDEGNWIGRGAGAGLIRKGQQRDLNWSSGNLERIVRLEP